MLVAVGISDVHRHVKTMKPQNPDVSSGVRGYSIRGTRVFDPGYAGIRYLIRGTRVLDPGYEGIRSGVRGYSIRGTRVLDPGYEGIRSGVRGY